MAKKKDKKAVVKEVTVVEEPSAPKPSGLDKVINSLDNLSNEDLNRVINACRGHLSVN